MALLQVDCALSAAPDHIHLGPHFVVGPGPLVDYTVVGKSGGELETIERANWRGRHDEEIAGGRQVLSATCQPEVCFGTNSGPPYLKMI